MNYTISPIKPWEPANIQKNLQDELHRRSQNRNFKYVKDIDGDWSNPDGAWSTAKGSPTSWIRVTSNGQGLERDSVTGKPLPPDQIKPGFIFSGGKDFYQTYGFGKTSNSNSSGNEQILGYQPNAWNTPHILNNDKTNNYPVNVPCPAISSINVEIQKELYRRATIEWTCFSKAQLEYMTPYFLVPGISCVLEWGWNHYNPDCLLDVADTKKLKDLMNNPYPLYTDHILKSNGNYDVMIGIITNFDWSVEGNKFKCKTEITSRDRIYAGLVTKATVEQAEVLFNADGTEIPKKEPPKFLMGSLEEFIANDIRSIKDVADKQSILHMYLIEQEAKAAGLIESKTVTTTTLSPSVAPIVNAQLSPNFKINLSSSTTSPDFTKLNLTNVATTMTKPLSYLYDQIISKSNLNNVSKFIDYVKISHPNNWKEYVYGIFFGRAMNESDVKNMKSNYSNVTDDFDIGSKSDELWLNFGLVIDILNYHASKLKFGDAEVFKISIDDIKITAHKNMISTDGEKLLIPNSTAPKYFVGGGVANEFSYGILDYIKTAKDFYFGSNPQLPDPYKVLGNTSVPPIIVNTALDHRYSASDIKLYLTCNQRAYGKIMRDDLNELINRVRIENSSNRAFTKRNFSFPSHEFGTANNEGYLKDLYINVKLLAHNPNITTYTEFIENLLSEISSACGNFWDLKLVSAAGDPNITEQSTMKIVDVKYIPKNTTGEQPYVFKLMSDESILLGMEFKPALSNAVAIRTIYAPTDTKSTNKIRLNNGSNELLDYKFKDRLTIAENNKSEPIKDTNDAGVIQGILKTLQTLKPTPAMYQMSTFYQTPADMAETSKNQAKADEINQRDGAVVANGKVVETVVVRRLVLPSAELLNILFDDGDYEGNTSYTGIMPGIQASFTLQGIGGLRTFQMFLVDLPEPYSKENIVFRITNVTETLSKGTWTTSIQAGVIPLRGYIKAKLGLK